VSSYAMISMGRSSVATIGLDRILD